MSRLHIRDSANPYSANFLWGKWSWQYSEDRWAEQEVLLKGPRSGDIEVFKP